MFYSCVKYYVCVIKRMAKLVHSAQSRKKKKQNFTENADKALQIWILSSKTFHLVQILGYPSPDWVNSCQFDCTQTIGLIRFSSPETRFSETSKRFNIIICKRRQYRSLDLPNGGLLKFIFAKTSIFFCFSSKKQSFCSYHFSLKTSQSQPWPV